MWQKSRGMSLIETLVAVGLLGIVVAISMGLLQQFVTSQKSLEVRFATLDFLKEINGILDVPGNCTETFNGFNLSSGLTGPPDPFGIPEIKLADSSVIYSVGNRYEGGNVELESLTLVDYQATNGDLDGQAQFEVQVKTSDSATIDHLRRTMTIALSLNADFSINSCSTSFTGSGANTSEWANHTWQSMEGLRAFNVNYDNDTGMSIQLNISTANSVTTACEARIMVQNDGVGPFVIAARMNHNGNALAKSCFVSAIIPPNDRYRVESAPFSGIATIETWKELRL